MSLLEIQDKVNKLYKQREYTNDIMILGLGLCEEAGEVAKAINQSNPKYKPEPSREVHLIEHELYDCMVYILGLANSLGINMQYVMYRELAKRLKDD